MYLLVSTSRLAENGDYNLSADRYREVLRVQNQKYQMVKIKEIFDVERGASPRPIEKYITEHPDGVNWIKIGDGSATSMYISSTKEKITREAAKKLRWVKKGDLLLSNSMSFGHPYIMNTEGCYHDGWLALRPKSNNLSKEFMYHILGSDQVLEQFRRLATGGVVNNLNSERVRNVEVPLPPLEIQQQIVDEIAAHQRIIDGARQVVEGWKPDIKVELEELLPESVTEWVVVRLGDAKIEIIDGDRGVNYPSKEDFSSEGYCLFLNTSNVRNGNFNFDTLQFISKTKEDKLRKGRLQRNDIVLTTRGTVGNIALYDETIPYEIMRINSGMVLLRSELTCIEPKYIVDLFQSPIIWNQLDRMMSGSAQPQLPIRNMVELKIPLPPLDIQRVIVARIERERAIVEGNRELIKIHEAKIKKVIERVWEG
jgi:restriction endonuclease S subunit